MKSDLALLRVSPEGEQSVIKRHAAEFGVSVAISVAAQWHTVVAVTIARRRITVSISTNEAQAQPHYTGC